VWPIDTWKFENNCLAGVWGPAGCNGLYLFVIVVILFHHFYWLDVQVVSEQPVLPACWWLCLPERGVGILGGMHKSKKNLLPASCLDGPFGVLVLATTRVAS